MDETDGIQNYYYNNNSSDDDFNDSSDAYVYLNDSNDAKDDDNSNNSSETNYDDDSNNSSDASDAEFDESQYLYMQQEYDNYDTPLDDIYESGLSEDINNGKFLIYTFNYKLNQLLMGFQIIR